MKKFLIHLLGGFTKEECAQFNVEHYDLGCRNTVDMLKRFADQMNGMPADDWCKIMYNHVVAYGERLEETVSRTDALGASAKNEQQ